MSRLVFFFFFFNDTATTEIYTLSLHDALPISLARWPYASSLPSPMSCAKACLSCGQPSKPSRSEEHTSELQSRLHLVCRLLLEKKKNRTTNSTYWTHTTPPIIRTALHFSRLCT